MAKRMNAIPCSARAIHDCDGPTVRVAIYRHNVLQLLDWYCQTAIAEDTRNGFAVKPIVTVCEYPPIPVRDHDWRAYRPGANEHGPYGWGETERAAVLNLDEREDEERD